jgi:hypothetical protein
MFEGTLPGPAQAVIRQFACELADEILVACSGNFTAERSIADLGLRIRSNDVSLYSSALGSLFAGQTLPIRLAEEYEERFGYMAPYLDSPLRTAATVMLAANLRSLEPRNPYYARQLRGWEQQWPQQHERLCAKLAAVRLRLAGYIAADALEVLAAYPDHPAISYPPYPWLSYEVMWRNLERLFVWNRPAYRRADEAWVEDLIGAITSRRQWLLALPQRRPDLEPCLRAVVDGPKTVYVYAVGMKASRYSGHYRRGERLHVPYLKPDEAVEPPLTIMPISVGQLAAVRDLYLAPTIYAAAPSYCFAVLANGRLIGCYGVRESAHGFRAGGIPQPSLLLVVDFAVQAPAERRLSRLVLLAALSREAQWLIEEGCGHRVRSLVTVALTRHPVSMKYRSTCELLSRRGPDEDGRYHLVYGATLGAYALDEVLNLWREGGR